MAEIFSQLKEFFTPNYNPAPFLISQGQGSYLYDQDGKKYLDFSSGIAVNNFGHCHPLIVGAIQEQAGRLLHCSNLYWNQPIIDLAKNLTSTSFADQAFFTNSGTEANEAAIKLARKYFFDRKEARPEILSFEGGFHGRSLGSLSATYKKTYREPFEPLVPGFRFLKFNDEAAISEITESTAAVLIEPVQGEAGVVPAKQNFLEKLRKRCNETGSLLIFDCIQVGMHRAEGLYGYESYSIEPDVMTLAKALGGGLPLGALLTKKEFGVAFTVGSHGTTFGGNPLCAAAGNAVFKIISDSKFRDQLHSNEKKLKEASEEIKKHSKVREVRCIGMMLGIDLDGDVNPIFETLRNKQILMTRIAPSTLRVLPPLNCQADEISRFVQTLLEVLG